MRVFKSEQPKPVTDNFDSTLEFIKSVHTLVTDVPPAVIEFSYLLNVLREAAFVVESMNEVTGGEVFNNAITHKVLIVDAAAASIKCSDCDSTIKTFSMLYDAFLA